MKPFLHGKKSVEAESLRAPTIASAAVTRGHAHGGSAAPMPASAQVEVVKEGDKVVRLIVTCTCGERIEIDCLYSAGR